VSVRDLIMAASGAVRAPTTWNPSDKNATVTLSGGNLVVTATTSGDYGSTRSIASVTAGKYYWETSITSILALNGFTYVGVSTSATTLHGSFPQATATAIRSQGGNIYVGSTDSTIALGNVGNGTVVCIALDITAGLIWFRYGAAGQWNLSGTANPATGTGGIDTAAIVSSSAPAFALASVYHNGTSGGVTTANFGGSAFTGAVPSGFSAGLG
jgi:hypothetical protein